MMLAWLSRICQIDYGATGDRERRAMARMSDALLADAQVTRARIEEHARRNHLAERMRAALEGDR